MNAERAGADCGAGAGLAAEAAHPAAGGNDLACVVPFRPRRILIVDDQPSVCEALAYVFSEAHYEVHIAQNGAEALALAARAGVDVALVGFHMRPMNGDEVCRLLRAHAAAAGRNVAVWVMTAAPTTEIGRKCTDAGAVALLRKPFDCEELLRAIDAQCAAVVSAPAASAARIA